MTTETDLQDKTKTELQDIADELGLPTSGNKDELIARIEEAETAEEPEVDTHRTDPPPPPVETGIGNSSNPAPREDTAAQTGEWVDVVSGEYQGRYGVYVQATALDDNGAPLTALVRTRDADNMLIEVPYTEIHPSERTGGR